MPPACILHRVPGDIATSLERALRTPVLGPRKEGSAPPHVSWEVGSAFVCVELGWHSCSGRALRAGQLGPRPGCPSAFQVCLPRQLGPSQR